jgi:hypothetical protein
MIKHLFALFLLFSMLWSVGCTGLTGSEGSQTTPLPTDSLTVAPAPAVTLDELHQKFGETVPVPGFLPEGYSFESASGELSHEGYTTLIYNGTAGDLQITRLASVNGTCPGMLSGIPGGSVQGDGVEAELTYDGTERRDDARKQLRWNRNEAAFCMIGNLSADEMIGIAGSVGG